MIIKICGITRAEDLKSCASLGIPWIGINLWERSRRHVPLPRALELAELARSLNLVPVAVLVSPQPSLLEELLKRRVFSLYQIHFPQDEIPTEFPWIRPIPVRSREDLTPPPSSARYDLFDAPQEGVGGGGKAFPWEYLEGHCFLRPSLIAGGLHPGNLPALLARVRPFGIDLASGVETAPGMKDPRKLEELVRIVSAWGETLTGVSANGKENREEPLPSPLLPLSKSS